MHEAGLASAIVAAARRAGVGTNGVRILVRGGDGDPAAFDDALRLHIGACDPPFDAAAAVIVHLEGPRLCVACGRSFDGSPRAVCPDCGGATLAGEPHERVELEVPDPLPASGGPNGPPLRDRCPSPDATPGFHARGMRTPVPAPAHRADRGFPAG